jgi:membrane protein implicated in regulation of membrane protease activity
LSPIGALVLALVALVVLGSLAGWLLNMPLWAIGAFSVVGLLLVRRTFRRLASRRARQDTEVKP